MEELSFADFKFCMIHHWLRCDDEKSEKAREKETDQEEDEEGVFETLKLADPVSTLISTFFGKSV